MFDDDRPRRRRRHLSPVVYDVPAAERLLPMLRPALVWMMRATAKLSHHRRRVERHDRPVETELQARQRRKIARGMRWLYRKLKIMGVEVLTPGKGIIGFPTLVNGARAFLIFEGENDSLADWRLIDDEVNRPIPAQWKNLSLHDPIEDGLPT